MPRKANPKTNWERKPNTGPGRTVGIKYDFTKHLRKVGDYIETHPMSREDVFKIRFAVHIWSWRHHCRIKTQLRYYPEGDALYIELISNTRKERK